MTSTSHVYRKTVATLMDDAGLSARQAAEQLGHSKISMTQDFYFGRTVASTGAEEVLEVFGDDPTPLNPFSGVSWGPILVEPVGHGSDLGFVLLRLDSNQ